MSITQTSRRSWTSALSALDTDIPHSYGRVAIVVRAYRERLEALRDCWEPNLVKPETDALLERYLHPFILMLLCVEIRCPKSGVTSSFLPEKTNCRVGKGRPAGSIELREIRCQFIILARKDELPSREGAPGGLDRASGFPFPLENSVRWVFPSTASNGPSVATFDDIPGLKCRPHPPHEAVLYATAVAAPGNT